MRENPGPPGWELSVRPAILPREKVLAVESQEGVARWIFQCRPL
jgi:hypothetical protein